MNEEIFEYIISYYEKAKKSKNIMIQINEKYFMKDGCFNIDLGNFFDNWSINIERLIGGGTPTRAAHNFTLCELDDEVKKGYLTKDKKNINGHTEIVSYYLTEQAKEYLKFHLML